MANYAVMEKGVVINVIVCDGIQPLSLAEGQTMVDLAESGAWLNWRLEDGVWIAPPVEEPEGNSSLS